MFTLDTKTEFGARITRRLREEEVIWLTAVDSHGVPQPNPVWFLWDGETIIIYSQPGARKVSHVRANPKVALQFNTAEDGNDVVIITGEAHIDPNATPANRNPAYLEKYRQGIADTNSTPDQMSEEYSTVIRVTPRHIRGW